MGNDIEPVADDNKELQTDQLPNVPRFSTSRDVQRDGPDQHDSEASDDSHDINEDSEAEEVDTEVRGSSKHKHQEADQNKQIEENRKSDKTQELRFAVKSSLKQPSDQDITDEFENWIEYPDSLSYESAGTSSTISSIIFSTQPVLCILLPIFM